MRSSANSRVRWATVTAEGVEDQEAADEQRDAGEDEQRGADEAERVGEVLRLLLRLLLAGAHRELGAELARDRGLQLLRRRPAGGRDRDVVVAVVARSRAGASGSVMSTSREPARFSESPSVAMPETV